MVSHWSDPKVRERDSLKDSLCEAAGLPLLRITSEFTRREGRQRVLDYVVEAFYLSEDFFKAQDQGAIPPDEPFDIGNFINRDDSGGLMFNTLDAPGRLRMLKHYEAKRLPSYAAHEFHTAVAAEGERDKAWEAVRRRREDGRHA
jgi:hypothetical protein